MAEKDKKKEKKQEKPDPKTLGSGLARTAAEKAIAHNKKICEATGGYFNAKTGSCD